MQHCIEQSYIRKKTLIVSAIDYKKAFDPIKRETIIERLMHYKIHHKIIETTANVYQDDHTEINYGDMKKNINVISGIKQVFTGSTVLFKLITYMIINELEAKGTGYSD